MKRIHAQRIHEHVLAFSVGADTLKNKSDPFSRVLYCLQFKTDTYFGYINTIILFPGEMCMSLLWYYRPEHVESGRKADDLPDEIFASKHRDFTSVACIEDKCYVMTFNEYCR